MGDGVARGLAIAALFAVFVAGAFLLRRPLYPLLAGQGGGVSTIGAGTAVALALAGVVVVRAAPVWFAQNLLLPATLLFAAILPPYWAGVEDRE